MLIGGQCLRSFSTLEQASTPYDQCPGLMAQENGHAFAHSGSEAALSANNDTIAECTTRVDQLLSKHNALSQQQAAFDDELEALRREEAELRQTIQSLQDPLQDVDAISLTEAELAPLQAQQSDASEMHATDTCDMDAKDSLSLGDMPMDCAEDRLQPAQDAAQQDPLRSQQDASQGHQHLQQHSDADMHVFGTVPVVTPLPEDPTAAMVLSCNRYTSSVSHLETFQNLGRLHRAIRGAQHYMSGRHHVVFVQPTAGALWSLPVVQRGMEQHMQQLDDLVAALGANKQLQETEEDARAANLAAQLAATLPPAAAHDESDPVRISVREHMHNFSCCIPAQLDQHGQWQTTFVDSNRLVADPKRELALPKFTRPWTKQEKDAMENVLGETGKKFAEVASKVGTRSIAECIDRYYKIHLRDEFKPTWRKMARLKRAQEGRNKRNEESKVLATVTKVARHRYDSLPRDTPGCLTRDPSSLRFPYLSDERLSHVPPVNARDFGSNTQLPLASDDGLKWQPRQNGRKRVMANAHSPVQPHVMAKPSGLDDVTEPRSLVPHSGLDFGDANAGHRSLLGASASFPSRTILGQPPLSGLQPLGSQPLAASASLFPLPEVPTKHAYPKGGGSVQPSLKFQMSTPVVPPMMRPVANGNVDETTSHGGQLQNIMSSTANVKVHAQSEAAAKAAHWEKNPPTC